MENQNPSLEELRKLYLAAIEFRDIRSWEWMYDSDLFGVVNPENNEIGYCCIMGNLKQVFALTVYLGSEGLEGYYKTASGEINPNDFNLLHYQKCLMASFEDRQYLEKKDLDIIKSLDFKFRGAHQWPLFRNYHPGYRPWYLTKSEVNYLTLALEQAKDVSLRFNENHNLLSPPQKGLYLVRQAVRKGDELCWSDEWKKPKPYKPKGVVPQIQIDELRLQRIKKYLSHSAEDWEVDFFYSPFGINEGERPFFPLILLIVDHSSQEIINFHLTGHSGYEQEFLDKFLTTIETIEFFPRSLLVKRKETYQLFLPLVEKIGLSIHFQNSLSSLEKAQESMFEYFSNQL